MGSIDWHARAAAMPFDGRALIAGTLQLNQCDDDDITVTFGGFMQSGNGRDEPLHAFDKYTELKTTWIRIDG